ncbi:hypothetical protein ACS3SW_15200 [Roseobacteraceae bacterium S113]
MQMAIVLFGSMLIPPLLWVALCIGILMEGWRRTFAVQALQQSVLAALIGAFMGGGAGLFWGLFPPLLWYLLFDSTLRTWQFWQSVFWLPACGAALLFVVALSHQCMRVWALSLALVSCFAGVMAVGEIRATRAMCEAAEDLGGIMTSRQSLLWSLRNTPAEYQFGLHAETWIGGQRYGWSYSEMGWYRIPETVYVNATPERDICGL